MKYLHLLTLLLVATSMSGAWAKSKSREFQAKILTLRVQEMINYRTEGLTNCLKTGKGYTQLDHQNYKNLISSYRRGKYSTQSQIIEKALELLAESQNHPKCAQEIKAADLKLKNLQQKKFEVAMVTAKASCALALNKSKICLKNVTTILNELDPFCVTQNSADYFGVKDGNACMAGDRLLGKVLRRKNDPNQNKLTQFLDDLDLTISGAPKNSNVDMWKVFLMHNQDSAANRKQFLALMTFFYYGLGSAGGYIDGVADHFWLSGTKEGKAPEEIFNEFFNMRQKIDRYGFLIHKKGKGSNLRYSFKHVSLKGMNRHDYMAMFMSCHFKGYGNGNAKFIPEILGFGYESLDFVSHIKEDVSLKESVKNFRTDTSRYTVGSTLGLGFCNYKF
jgi:hypothetical protein